MMDEREEGEFVDLVLRGWAWSCSAWDFVLMEDGFWISLLSRV